MCLFSSTFFDRWRKTSYTPQNKFTCHPRQAPFQNGYFSFPTINFQGDIFVFRGVPFVKPWNLQVDGEGESFNWSPVEIISIPIGSMYGTRWAPTSYSWGEITPISMAINPRKTHVFRTFIGVISYNSIVNDWARGPLFVVFFFILSFYSSLLVGLWQKTTLDPKNPKTQGAVSSPLDMKQFSFMCDEPAS